VTGGSIDLETATSVVDATLAHGASIGCHPLTVAVLDAGGHLVALKRQDRSGILRVEIAFGKAWGALGMRLPSRDLVRRAGHVPHFVDSLPAVSSGRVVLAQGGVLIRHGEDVIGAVGVSGDHPDRDEECAVSGIEAAGLEADASSTDPH
jgi:uncharacterized protein GlcG (DUF336 family)